MCECVVRLIALRRAKGLQGTTPGDDLIEHAGDRRLQLGTRLEGREILEIGEEGEADLCPHVGELDVADHLAEYFHGARPAIAAIADESDGLVVPFAV